MAWAAISDVVRERFLVHGVSFASTARGSHNNGFRLLFGCLGCH